MTAEKLLIERLVNNDSKLERLDLNEKLSGVILSDLIRALCMNTTLKHVTIDDKFMENLSFEKARIILEIIGGLEELEALILKFPDEFLNLNHKMSSDSSTITSRSSKFSVRTNHHNANTSTAVLLQSAIAKAPKLRWIEVHNLQLHPGTDDDSLLVMAFSKAVNLKKINLIDWVIITTEDDDNNNNINIGNNHNDETDSSSFAAKFQGRIIDVDKFRSENEFGNVDASSDTDSFHYMRSRKQLDNIRVDLIMDTFAELPHLEELEIRMKTKQPLPGVYLFANLCSISKSLRSLVIWNMVLSMTQVRCICDALCENTSIKRLEIWRCTLGRISPTRADDDGDDDNTHAMSNGNGHSHNYDQHDDSYFGILLADVVENNKTLETFVLSHVGLNHAGCVALARALRQNRILQDLALLALAPTDKDHEKSDQNNNSSISKDLTPTINGTADTGAAPTSNGAADTDAAADATTTGAAPTSDCTADTDAAADATTTDAAPTCDGTADTDAAADATTPTMNGTTDTDAAAPTSNGTADTGAADDDNAKRPITEDSSTKRCISRDVISKAIIHMMNNSTKGVKSLHVTYDELSMEDCIVVSKQLQNNYILRRLNDAKKSRGFLRRFNDKFRKSSPKHHQT